MSKEKTYNREHSNEMSTECNHVQAPRTENLTHRKRERAELDEIVAWMAAIYLRSCYERENHGSRRTYQPRD